MPKLNIKILLFISVSIFLFSFSLNGSAERLAHSNQTASSQTFFYSKHFAKRFELPIKKAAKDWNTLLAILINHDQSIKTPHCKMTLYLGADTPFNYPQDGSYLNFVGKQFDELFFFKHRFNSADERQVTKNSRKAVNRLKLEVRNDVNKLVATTGLTIDYVARDVVPGINIIKTLPFFCDFMQNNTGKVNLLFLDSVTVGDETRSRVMSEYTLPLSL